MDYKDYSRLNARKSAAEAGQNQEEEPVIYLGLDRDRK